MAGPEGAKHVVVASPGAWWRTPCAPYRRPACQGHHLRRGAGGCQRQCLRGGFDCLVAAAYGPITGVYHTAMVLQDGLIRAWMRISCGSAGAPRSMAPAISTTHPRPAGGAVSCCFSSISALIGNPGQGALVAANAYLGASPASAAPRPASFGGGLGVDRRCRRAHPRAIHRRAVGNASAASPASRPPMRLSRSVGCCGGRTN